MRQGATEMQGGAWCGFGAFLGVFESYLGVERSDYGAVGTDDDFLVTRGLAVKDIIGCGDSFKVVQLRFTCLLGTHLRS